jgi:hypothetical protein
MLSNDPFIVYGPVIILSCIIFQWALVNYLEEYFYEDDNYE